MLLCLLGAAPAHASQILSRNVPIESSSSTTICSDLLLHHNALPLGIEPDDKESNSCLEAVSEGNLEKLHWLLWDRPKSDTIVSCYCATEVNEIPLPPEIRRLMSDFICVFEDANKVQYENGVNLLHTACTFLSKQSVSIVALILTLDINVNAQSKYGHTALHDLCEHRFNRGWEKHILVIVNSLIKKGATCKIQNDWQENPLHILCKHRFSANPLPLGILKRFAEKKEAINAVNKQGKTPLHILCNNAPSSSLDYPKSTCIHRLLINVNKVTYYHAWKRSQCGEGIKYLLTHGGQPSLRIQATVAKGRGHTPYELARKAGFRKPCLCCGIICCNQKIALPCFSTCRSTDHTAKDLLLAVDPLAGSVCPKLSYCCWATRTDTKLIMLMWTSVVTAAAIGLTFTYL